MKEMVEVPHKLVDDEHYLRFRPFNNMDFLKYLNTEEGKACTIESYCGVTIDNITDFWGFDYMILKYHYTELSFKQKEMDLTVMLKYIIVSVSCLCAVSVLSLWMYVSIKI